MFKFKNAFLFIVLYCFNPVALPASAQVYPNHYSSFVNDFADLIDEDTEARITQVLQDLRENQGKEMTVVTINSRMDYGPDTGLEPFATGLFNAWGVGNAERDDGILFLISSGDRETRVELGAGYGPIYDDRMKTVIDHTIIPFFREGNFSAGIESGVLEIIKRTDAAFVDEPETPNYWFLDGLKAMMLQVVLILGITLMVFRRRVADLFMRFKHCPKCGQRTLKSETKTLLSPTRLSQGQGERLIWCTNCDHSQKTFFPISRLSSGSNSDSGSSGGSSGGSFGGGSSSGGGASGRW